MLHRKVDLVKKNDEFNFYIKFIFIVAAIVAVILFMQSYSHPEESFRDSLFQVVSMVTTTGYVTADYELWGPFFQAIFFILLFVGGCAGSTGGGIKVVRHQLLIKNSMAELRRLIHPRAVIPVRYNENSVPQEILANIAAFFLFYIGIFALGTIIMSILGLDFPSALGAVATSIGNVGPAIGSVGPSYNFSHVHDLGKWFLSLLMLLGRLELFTILIIFSPSFWKT
jgi:trk system potassium uptake protein TrkH